MKISCTLGVTAALALSSGVEAFQAPRQIGRVSTKSELGLFSFGKKEEKPVELVEVEKPSIFSGLFKKAPTPAVVEPEIDESWTDFGSTPWTYAYAATWAALVTFAFGFAPGEFNSASDTAMLQSIIENPAAPAMNPFYYGIFNLFALIPVVLAATIVPRASDKGIPAGPPLFLSTFIAYFIMGPYLALRKTPLDTAREDLGWAKIFENKLLSYGTVAFGFLCLASGAPGLEDPVGNWNGMLELLSTSRFASVSFADLTMITLILTKEVADDYAIRCDLENVEKAPLIGASTAFLPILGAAIYCAARPALPESGEDA